MTSMYGTVVTKCRVYVDLEAHCSGSNRLSADLLLCCNQQNEKVFVGSRELEVEVPIPRNQKVVVVLVVVVVELLVASSTHITRNQKYEVSMKF